MDMYHTGMLDAVALCTPSATGGMGGTGEGEWWHASYDTGATPPGTISPVFFLGDAVNKRLRDAQLGDVHQVLRGGCR